MNEFSESTQWGLVRIAAKDPVMAQRIEGALRCMATIQAQEAARAKVTPIKRTTTRKE